MKQVFGYPKFDTSGKMILTTYDNDYSDMLMDISVYKKADKLRHDFLSKNEEIAILLLKGKVNFSWNNESHEVYRKDVFTDGPYAVHVCRGNKVSVTFLSDDAEFLVMKTQNMNEFSCKLYTPKDAPFKYFCKGMYGDVAKRRVNTIIDHDIEPLSNFVLGETLNDRGNWSGYLPHRHPQPETYFFKFDREEGFGASFVGDQVFKSVNNSFAAIPGGQLHPQAVAPGFQMYTCWMIRHLDGNPWLQTDRCEDEKYLWLKDAKF